MNLIEALKLQSQLTKQTNELSVLIEKCCQAQEGDEPPFDPNQLFQEYEDLLQELIELSIRIQTTNNIIKFKYLDNPTPRSMTQALADVSKLEALRYSASRIVNNGIITRGYSNKKIKDVAYADVVKYHKISNEFDKQLNSLSLSIQNANHEFELI
ncbi:predicted protein [Candida tropicalis MYA-3404]|uniref:Uncharacterized protein n=1 Tax=Candida tropicalis (strain ATCC MYA-3404 / T1) TaxID=294747 RepID=C5M3H6_CANTT|nr:predicted protein [Candida tropicalis MYA-3404]EER35876.1 predicted protein [Candida tropicalis MYA-3404]KAG4409992.1 hypothetical protein JTP64_000630 [Candida tropicalis]MCP8717227.1 DIP1984 family protein [Asgard group archaeon]